MGIVGYVLELYGGNGKENETTIVMGLCKDCRVCIGVI